MSVTRIILLLGVATATFAVVLFYAKPELLEGVWLWLVGLAGTVARLFQLLIDLIKRIFKGDEAQAEGNAAMPEQTT